MKRHLMAVLCFGIVLTASLARTQDPQRLESPPSQDLINDLQSGWDTPPDDALREQLLRLIEEKTQLMDREALEEALSEVQDDIGELQARQKLEEARRILSSIVEDHEGTEGARRAQRLLDTDDEPLPRTVSVQQYNPI